MALTEQEILAQGTWAFILADPVSLQLRRRNRNEDGAGGFSITDGTWVAAQTFRLIPRSDKVPEVTTSDGKTAQPEFTILGTPESIMERYMRFLYNGRTYEIAQVHNGPAYERKGDVVRIA